MKVKLQSRGKLQLAKAVKDVLDLGLKEAKDLVDEQEAERDMGFHVIVDSEKTKEQIKEITEGYGVNCIPLSDIDICKPKQQEVTDEDLGVSIHSIDEMSIGWQCKMLFTHEQAIRVLAGLRDAKFNVTKVPAMYEGNETTMLVVTKTFPTGTRKKDLEKFEKLIRKLIGNTCEIVNLEERIESAKEAAIAAFEDIRNYE